MDTSNFITATGLYIRRHRLLRAGEAVLLAVSGGADSVALAKVLLELAQYRLHVGHVHHGLRKQADQDADFVAELAKGWGLPFHLARIDTPGLARQWGAGIEEAARRGRYQALGQLAAGVRASAVAVAHHADDQVETVLHRMIRGTHIRGLAGMRPTRLLEDGKAAAIRLVRPLLWARRTDIEQFCRASKLDWRTDHTNAQTEYTRNFLRHELLPLLRERVNPKADEALLRLAEAAEEANDLLERQGRRLFERALRKQSPRQVSLRLAALKKAHPLLSRTALRLALEAVEAPQRELGLDRYADLQSVLEGTLSSVDLPGGVKVRRVGQTIVVEKERTGF